MPDSTLPDPLTGQRLDSALLAQSQTDRTGGCRCQYLGARCAPAVNNLGMWQSPAIGKSRRNDGQIGVQGLDERWAGGGSTAVMRNDNNVNFLQPAGSQQLRLGGTFNVPCQ